MIGALTATLFDEARRIWCYRWLALAVSMAVFVAGAAYIARMHHVYDAWAQVFISKQSPLTVAAEGVSLGGDSSGSTYVVQKTLLNDDSLERVVKLRNPTALSLDRAQLARAAAGLRNQIRVVADQDGFVEFHYSDTDPVRARDTVALLLDQFISRSVGRSRTDLDRAEKFLDQQIASYAGMLLESQSNIAAFRSRHPEAAYAPVVAPGAEIDLPGPTELPPAEGAAAGTSAIATAAAPPATPAAAPPRPPRPTPAADRVAALQAKLATLLTTYTDQYPDVVATRRQLAEATVERDREAAAIAAAMAAEPAAAPSTTTAERAGSPGARRRVAVSAGRAPPPVLAPAVAAEWVDLQRRDQVLRLGYQQLIGKRDATRMSEAIYDTNDAGKYQVTRPPTTPTEPSGPNRRLFLGIATLLAIGCGLCAAYVRAGMKGILVSPNELENAFQLPVVGTVALESAWHTRRPADWREAKPLPSPSPSA